MQPAHARIADGRDSLVVSRFYFSVRVENGKIFELYFDLTIAKTGDRKGHWFLLGEKENRE